MKRVVDIYYYSRKKRFPFIHPGYVLSNDDYYLLSQ